MDDTTTTTADLAATAGEEEPAGLLACRLYVDVNRLTGQLGQLESDGLPGLLLAHYCPVDGLPARRDVLDPQADHVATAQLAVDRQIEHCQVAGSAPTWGLVRIDQTCLAERRLRA